MLRRIGYGLGMLFVLACVLAYPLTWTRWAGLTVRMPWMLELGTQGGQVQVYWNEYGAEWGASLNTSLYDDPPSSSATWQFRVVREPGDWGSAQFPLWVLPLATSLFMAWWWRRRRTRRGAAGFPMGDVSD
jgi:hypothetical protein